MPSTEAVAQTAELVRSIIAATPPGQSKFIFLATTLKNEQLGENSAMYVPTMHAMSGILAASVLFYLISLIIKWFRTGIWLYKMEENRGRVIVPHYTNCWAFWMIPTLGLTQGFLWINRNYATSGPGLQDFAFWNSYTWIPGIIGLWTCSWSLLVIHKIHQTATGDAPDRFYNRAWFLNLVGIAIPVVCICTVCPFGYKSSQHWRTAFALFDSMTLIVGRQILMGVADPGEDFIMEIANTTALALENLESMAHYMCIVYSCYAAIGGVVLTTFVITAILHLRTLSQTLKELQLEAKPTSPEEIAIKSRFRQLIKISIGFATIATIFEGLLIYTAVASNKIATDKGLNEILTLLALFVWGTLSFPLSIYFIWNACTERRNTPRPDPSREAVTLSQADLKMNMLNVNTPSQTPDILQRTSWNSGADETKVHVSPGYSQPASPVVYSPASYKAPAGYVIPQQQAGYQSHPQSPGYQAYQIHPMSMAMSNMPPNTQIQSLPQNVHIQHMQASGARSPVRETSSPVMVYSVPQHTGHQATHSIVQPVVPQQAQYGYSNGSYPARSGPGSPVHAMPAEGYTKGW